MKPLVLQNGQLAEASVSLDPVAEWSQIPTDGLTTASSGGSPTAGIKELELTCWTVGGFASGSAKMNWSRNTAVGTVDFANAPTIRLTLAVGNVTTSATIRALMGRTNYTSSAALGDKGYGFEVRTGRLWLVTHDGTALTQSDTGVSLTANTTYVFVFGISEGTLYLRANGVAFSCSGAPTTGTPSYAYLQLSHLSAQATSCTSTWSDLHYSNGVSSALAAGATVDLSALEGRVEALENETTHTVEAIANSDTESDWTPKVMAGSTAIQVREGAGGLEYTTDGGTTVHAMGGGGGGTSLPTPTVGEILYCATAGTWSALPAPGTVGQVLTAVESGANRIPQWMLPANQYTPRVQVWLNRIALAGGTLTDDSEDIAVAFVDAMNARSWAGKITYLLPFLGGNLAAGIVPIVDTRGVGAPINTGFANADFSESTGIQGASTKWLNTQLTVAQLGASGNGGLGIIELSLPSPAVSREEGGYADSATDRRYGLYTRTSSPWRIFWWGNPSVRVESTTALAPAHIYGQRSSATDRRLYIDGVLAGTTTANDPSELAAQTPLFALGSQQGTYPDYGDPVRCGAWYATDGTLTDAEVADLHDFLQQYLITPTGR